MQATGMKRVSIDRIGLTSIAIVAVVAVMVGVYQWSTQTGSHVSHSPAITRSVPHVTQATDSLFLEQNTYLPTGGRTSTLTREHLDYLRANSVRPGQPASTVQSSSDALFLEQNTQLPGTDVSQLSGSIGADAADPEANR